jgi:hypothetical protein
MMMDSPVLHAVLGMYSPVSTSASYFGSAHNSEQVFKAYVAPSVRRSLAQLQVDWDNEPTGETYILGRDSPKEWAAAVVKGHGVATTAIPE